MSATTQAEILLVEDNATDAELTLLALKKSSVAGRVAWVKDGAEALDFLFQTGVYSGREVGNPRLVLLDLKLPKVDGIEVLRRIKSDDKTRTIPVVMVTSSGEERDVAESYRIGVNSYLVKPVDFKQFMDVVTQACLYWSLINKAPQ